MTPNLTRIEAALNAYPWTSGAFVATSDGTTRYCAVGMFLRYAGVSREHIDVACNQGAVRFWEYYASLLERDYGLSSAEQLHAIMVANDGAESHDDALGRIRGVLARMPIGPADVLALLPPLPSLWSSLDGSRDDDHAPLASPGSR